MMCLFAFYTYIRSLILRRPIDEPDRPVLGEQSLSLGWLNEGHGSWPWTSVLCLDSFIGSTKVRTTSCGREVPLLFHWQLLRFSLLLRYIAQNRSSRLWRLWHVRRWLMYSQPLTIRDSFIPSITLKRLCPSSFWHSRFSGYITLSAHCCIKHPDLAPLHTIQQLNIVVGCYPSYIIDHPHF